MDVSQIPKHSPQVNALDDYLWSDVNKCMRAAKRKCLAKEKTETLCIPPSVKRTANCIPRQDVNEAAFDASALRGIGGCRGWPNGRLMYTGPFARSLQ